MCGADLLQVVISIWLLDDCKLLCHRSFDTKYIQIDCTSGENFNWRLELTIQ